MACTARRKSASSSTSGGCPPDAAPAITDRERITAGCERGPTRDHFQPCICRIRFCLRDGVLCRIERRRESAGLIVRLAGRLSAEHVPELLAACADPAAPILELDELVSADAVGVDALLRLERQGVRLAGLPEYLRLTLDTLRTRG